MLPTNGKILWLKAGKKADGYYQPTINEDKTSYRYPLRSSFWNTTNDVRLGEITDTNQPDLDNSFTTSSFIEFKDEASGEFRYIPYNAESFDSRYEVREPESSSTDNLVTIYRKNRSWVIIGALAIATAIGVLISKKGKAAMRSGSR